MNDISNNVDKEELNDQKEKQNENKENQKCKQVEQLDLESDEEEQRIIINDSCVISNINFAIYESSQQYDEYGIDQLKFNTGRFEPSYDFKEDEEESVFFKKNNKENLNFLRQV